MIRRSKMSKFGTHVSCEKLFDVKRSQVKVTSRDQHTVDGLCVTSGLITQERQDVKVQTQKIGSVCSMPNSGCYFEVSTWKVSNEVRISLSVSLLVLTYIFKFNNGWSQKFKCTLLHGMMHTPCRITCRSRGQKSRSPGKPHRHKWV